MAAAVYGENFEPGQIAGAARPPFTGLVNHLGLLLRVGGACGVGFGALWRERQPGAGDVRLAAIQRGKQRFQRKRLLHPQSNVQLVGERGGQIVLVTLRPIAAQVIGARAIARDQAQFPARPNGVQRFARGLAGQQRQRQGGATQRAR